MGASTIVYGMDINDVRAAVQAGHQAARWHDNSDEYEVGYAVLRYLDLDEEQEDDSLFVASLGEWALQRVEEEGF